MANVEGPLKAIADIRLRIEHGATVNEVNAAYEAHAFPELERVESQMAMIKVVEKVGQSAIVQEVLAQECTGKDEVDLQDVGFKALISTLAKESFKVDEIITQFQPEDFEEASVLQRLAQLVTEAQQLDMAEQVSPVQLASADQVIVHQVTTVIFLPDNWYLFLCFFFILKLVAAGCIEGLLRTIDGQCQCHMQPKVAELTFKT